MQPATPWSPIGRTLLTIAVLVTVCVGARTPATAAEVPSLASNQIAGLPEASVASSGPLADDTLILTVGSRPVYWTEYRFWLTYLGRYYENTHGLSAITDWHARQDGVGLKESFLNGATAYVCNDTAIEGQSAAAGIQLTPEDVAELTRVREDNIKIYGSYSEYLRIVGSMYGSEAQFQYLAKIERLSKYLFAHLYGAGGDRCSDDCVTQFTEAQGLSAALYIFRSNTDASGKPVNSRKRRSNDQLLGRLHAQLQASSSPAALFSRLMNRYSDDSSLGGYLNGRIIARGSKGREFDLALRNLADSAYSNVISTRAGGYLILRKPLSPNMVVDNSGTTLRYWAAYQGLFKPLIERWCADLSIQYSDAFGNIDMEGLLR
jgi:hypothetical protein